MKYYAVVCGVNPGIYTDWPTAQSQVKGFKGAIYKSFSTRAEAEAFINQSTACQNKEEAFHVSPLPDRTIIYTDGSMQDNACGFGVVIITPGREKITAYGRVPVHLGITNNVAELYAIYVAFSLITGNVLLYSDSRYAISALTSYIHAWKQSGWQGVANAEIIKAIESKMVGRSISFQHVPAHVGIELNEEADRLADMGRLQTEELVVMKNGLRMGL